MGLFIENGFRLDGWLEGFIALLVDFADWNTENNKSTPDLAPIWDALIELGCEPADLKKLEAVNSQYRPISLHPLQPPTQKTPMSSKSKSQTNPAPSKPRLFIGSSSEAIRIAEAIQANLDHDLECTIWTQGVFGLSSSTLESLEKRLNQSDFAVLVVTPDDITDSRGDKTASPRDNVIFELGLFMGALGRKRTFLVQPRNKNIKIPSDLFGINVATYDDARSDGSMRAATGKACSDIKEAVNANASQD